MRDSAPLLHAYVKNTVKGSWRPTSTSDHRTWPIMAGFHPSFTIAPSFSLFTEKSLCLCARSTERGAWKTELDYYQKQ